MSGKVVAGIMIIVGRELIAVPTTDAPAAASSCVIKGALIAVVCAFDHPPVCRNSEREAHVS